MTCLLTHHFKYLLRLQQCQIKDESTMKQECKKKKKIKLLLKKNIKAVATLTTGKGEKNPHNVFYSDWETRRRPRLPPRCSLTSPPSMCSCVAAVSSRAGRCERHHSSKCSLRKAARQFTAKTSRYLRTPYL